MRCISLPRLLLTSFLLTGIAASTASAAVQDRISTAISSSRVTIPNSVHGKVRLATDLGPAAPDTKLEAMTLRFSMTAAQQAALDQLLLDQQNPSSPRYHQWLTPGQYAAQFGLSSADLAKVTAWLTSQGFAVTEIANSATFIRFNGTVAQAQTAFATSIHNVSLNGETHFANVTDAAVPSAFAGVVLGVTGLHDFKLKSRVRSHVVSDPAHTQFTSSLTGNHYIAPGDFYTIYDVNALYGTGINGTGVTIGIMGQVDINLPDVAAFRAASGLSANLPAVQTYGRDPGPPICSSCTTGPNSGDLAESSLDLEWSGAIAPSAKIIFVNSTDVLFGSLTDAVDDPTFTASIISVSYGDCEPSWGQSNLNILNATFQMANARGITIVGPSGDDGASDCDSSDTSATEGLTVDFPASSPFVTGLGGTMFNEGTATGTTSFWNTNSSSATANAGSAISYIPEAVWNEDAAGAEFASGGGGVSVYFPKPTWQVGTGVPATNFRYVPDISLDAAASHDGYLYCVQGSCTNGTFRDANSNLTEAGGTSFATPNFAAILALVEQKLQSRIGNANPAIYAMANSTFYNNIFHDVTTGNNNSACTPGIGFTVPVGFTPVPLTCPSSGTIGYSAGVGYDEATGWGTIDVANLASHWAAITPPVTIPGSTADFTLATSTPTITIASPTQTTASFSVAPVNGFTGTVSFLVTSASTTGVTPAFSFSPTSVPGGTGTTTLTISFPTASLSMPVNGVKSSAGPTLAERSQRHAPWYAAGSGAAMAFMLCFALPRKRRLGTLLVAALAIAMAAGASGCSSGNSTVSAGSGSSTPTSAVGSYTVVVSATSVGSTSTTTHAVTVNLIVQ
jgi:subtilase family serine protease